MTARHARAARLREGLAERLAQSERVHPVAEWQIVERRFAPEPGVRHAEKWQG